MVELDYEIVEDELESAKEEEEEEEGDDDEEETKTDDRSQRNKCELPITTIDVANATTDKVYTKDTSDMGIKGDMKTNIEAVAKNSALHSHPTIDSISSVDSKDTHAISNQTTNGNLHESHTKQEPLSSQQHLQHQKEKEKKVEKEEEEEKTNGKQNNKDKLNNYKPNDEKTSQSISITTASDSSKKTLKPKINGPEKKRVWKVLLPNAKRQMLCAKRTLRLKFNKDKTAMNTISRPPSQIEKQIAGKPKNVDPQSTVADKFPYSGPILTTIKPAIPAYPIVIPSYARWFRLDRIHPIEHQALIDIFSGKGMHYHQRYLEIRNFIVNCYRMNPRIYLAADAALVLQIHKFLEEWGIINYQVDPGSIPEFEPPMVDYTHVDTPFGVKRALQPVFATTTTGTGHHEKPSDWSSMKNRENMVASAAVEYAKDMSLSHCQNDTICIFCSLDCTYARYRSKIDNFVIICAECYQNTRYPCIFTPEDFEMELFQIKKEKKSSSSVTNTDEKTSELKPSNKTDHKASIAAWDPLPKHQLLEALRTHRPDWDKFKNNSHFYLH
ncbi:hypothetical protein RFI_27724 [Reticulomyxa filosa]|uniref:SWIRM domain-containing protein n=1 Tax=Reticulomyxa filosa TaxID=46433 RepID=X6M6V8_RETFI|nr:hypothetical protein RFI_27724 [Reticulomyxa filosa]|eukprot:ETO09654.1 hypothetical protein RFI_27724 [Reticulomyxa filosa]